MLDLPASASDLDPGLTTPQPGSSPSDDGAPTRFKHVEQALTTKRTRYEPLLPVPSAKRALTLISGVDRYGSGGNAGELSLLDDDMLLSSLGWEMADDAEDGTAHGSFAVAAAMRRAASGAAPGSSGGGAVGPSELASLARDGLDLGADDSVTGGQSAAAALTAAILPRLLSGQCTSEPAHCRSAVGTEAYAGTEECAGRGGGEGYHQQQQQMNQTYGQGQHRSMQLPTEPQQPSQPETTHLADCSSPGTRGTSELRGFTEYFWPDRRSGTTLPAPTPSPSIMTILDPSPHQAPCVPHPGSQSVRGGSAAAAAIRGSQQLTDPERNHPVDLGGEHGGGDVTFSAPLSEDEILEGLLSEAAAALLEPLDLPGSPSRAAPLPQACRLADPAASPSPAGAWCLGAEHAGAAEGTTHQWQQLEERSRRLDAVVREKEQLHAALAQSKARLLDAQRLLRCKLCHTSRRNCVVLPCMHFSYCHGCIATHCSTDAHCPACASPVSGFQTLLLID